MHKTQSELGMLSLLAEPHLLEDNSTEKRYEAQNKTDSPQSYAENYAKDININHKTHSCTSNKIK